MPCGTCQTNSPWLDAQLTGSVSIITFFRAIVACLFLPFVSCLGRIEVFVDLIIDN